MTAVGLMLPATQASAATGIGVDFSSSLGVPQYRASGTLYGMTEDGSNPPSHFYTDIKWHFERAGGAQLGGGGWVGGGYTRRWNSVLGQARRTAALGGTFVILPHDLWGADGAGISTWPGDNGDWTNFDNFLSQLFADVKASGINPQWDLWNEPDLGIFWRPSQSQYLAMWKHFYQRVRSTFPNAVIVGPSTSSQPSTSNGWWATFLDYAKANNVVPDVFSWHDESGDPAVDKPNADAALAAHGIAAHTYQINEYAGPSEQNPGAGGWYITRLERANIDGLRGNWGSGSDLHDDAAGLLVDNGGGQYQPLGEWFTYQFYGSMTGTRVAVAPSGDLDAVATKDTANAKVLLGNHGGTTGTVNVTLNRLDTVSVVQSGQVRVVVQRTPFNGGGTASGPVTVSDRNVNVTSNTATISVNWGSAQDGYTITLLPPTGVSPTPTTAPPTSVPPTTAPPTTAPPTTKPPTSAPPTTAPPTTAPPTTAPPTTKPPTSGPPPATGCSAAYQLGNSWPGGFQGGVTVTNNGTTPLTSWTVRWSFPNGQTIGQLWNGSYVQSGANVTVTNASYNGTIAPGQSTTFGFIGSWTGTNTAPASVSCG